jgi:hypothetical protein
VTTLINFLAIGVLVFPLAIALLFYKPARDFSSLYFVVLVASLFYAIFAMVLMDKVSVNVSDPSDWPFLLPVALVPVAAFIFSVGEDTQQEFKPFVMVFACLVTWVSILYVLWKGRAPYRQWFWAKEKGETKA